MSGLVDLELFGVYDGGIPNTERIVLRANTTVDLTNYGLIIGLRAAGETLFPVPDFFLWLGRTTIEGPAWVFVYTGVGDPKVSRETHTGEPMHAIYWNRPHVLFGDPNVRPALIRFGEVHVYSGVNKKLQLPPPKTEAPAIDFKALFEELRKLNAPEKK